MTEEPARLMPGVFELPNTSRMASEVGVMEGPMMTSTLCSSTSLRAARTAALGSLASSSTT